MRILLVDDHAALAEAIRRILERDGHQVVVALAGKDAIDAIQPTPHAARPFDVVMTDYSMPDVDGLKVAASVKSVSPSTSVVLMTAYHLGADELPRHVDALLVKPPGINAVRAVLTRLARNPSTE